MATLICNGTGNLTGASTFAAVETGTGALSIVRNNHIQHGAAGTNTSSTFTVTNGSVIDGAIVWIANENAGTQNGTLKVDLLKGGVSQASVTVNKADLPLYVNAGYLGPVFFKFTGTAVGDGGANWTLATTSTGSTTLRLIHAGSAANFTRALRKTTSATAAAGDDLLILGELTGPGTHTSYTVTMDSTTATDYGNGAINTGSVGGGLIAIGMWGTLSYGTAASTNYILRASADVIVYYLGTFNIGSSGAEIPRNSTAVLEFDQVSADGDFGLHCRDGGVLNIAGLSRTSGKNVVKCKLTSDVVGLSVVNTSATVNGTVSVGGLDATGLTFNAGQFVDNATSGSHGTAFQNSVAVTNTTQTGSVWLAQGSGTNNRYVRLSLGNSGNFLTITHGSYVDVDLQAGTLGTHTVVGAFGVATSVSITAVGRGWLLKITGKVNAGAASQQYLVLSACSAPGTISYVGNTTQCFVYDHMVIVTAASTSDTTFNVDADTGWLLNDAVCVASTSRSYTECEIYPLNANAGASSFVSTLYPGGTWGVNAITHSGTAPAQAEIGLLTRNVKIRSTSPTLMTYVYGLAMSTMTVSWAEFYYVGANILNKYGISIDAGTTTNPKSFTYCSVHDVDGQGVVLCGNGAGTSLNVVFSNNVMWNNNVAYFVYTNGLVTNNDYTLDNNLVMRTNGANGGGFNLLDVGGVITNNTAVGSNGGGSHGFLFNETSGVLGTFSGNSAHAMGGWGVLNNGTITSGLINNFTAWRNTTGAFHTNGGDVTNLVLNNFVAFGNAAGIIINASTALFTMTGVNVIASEAAYICSYGISQTVQSPTFFDVTGVDFTGTSIGLSAPVPHTNGDIYFVTAATFYPLGHFNDCKFNTNYINSKAAWVEGSYLTFQRYGQVDGEYRTDTPYGRIISDNVIYNSSSRSMRMIPTSSLKKLEQTPDGRGIRVTAASGRAVTASVWIRKDATYSGAQPRLGVRANPAMGITSDTILATCSDVTSSSSLPTWDATTAINVGLSGGNLVLLNDGSVDQNNQGVRVSSAHEKTEGKFYFENTLTTRTGGSSVGFGIGVIGSTYPNIGGGNALGGTMTYIGGGVASNGVSSGNLLGSRATGDVWGAAFDLSARRAWFRAFSGGVATGWTTGGDPTLGTGGTAIPSGAMVPFATFGGAGNSNNNRFTTNFGSSAFVMTPPTGYIAGWGIPSGAVGTFTWVQISGTTAVVTDDGVLEFFVDCDIGSFINVEDWVFT